MNGQSNSGPAWEHALTSRVGQRVKELRTQRGISAQQLSARTAATGSEVKRSVIAAMENGNRTTIPLADVLVLARALSVPPVLLLVPLSDSEPIEILPQLELAAWDALDWLTGEDEIDEVARWVLEVNEDESERGVWQESVRPLQLKRELERTELNLRGHELWVDIYSKAMKKAATPEQLEANRQLVVRETELAARSAQELEEIKEELSTLGVTWRERNADA